MKVEKAACFSFHMKGEESLAQLRLTGPLNQAGIGIIEGFLDNQVNADSIHDADIVVTQREIPVEYSEYRKIFDIAHKEGKPVVFDLDDLLFFLPEDHPDRRALSFIPALLPMFQALREADLITVSTPKLAEVLGAYCTNVAVLPNYLDDHLWRLKPPVRREPEDGVLTIGYMGGYSHKPDMEYIAPVLRDLIQQYPQRIRFQFWGLEPPEELRVFPQVTYSLSYYHSYREFAVFFQSQNVDIFLSPLVDNLFNRCKSPVKFLEYSALGAPGVYSRLETYGEVVRHGENGLLASTLDEWKKYIIQLIENDKLRYDLACTAQETVREGWLLSRNSYRWKETYQDRAGVSMNQGYKKNEIDIVGSIHSQLFEAIKSKESEIEAMRGHVAEMENKLQELEARATEHERRIEDLAVQVTERESKIEDLVVQATKRERKIEELLEENNRAEVEAAQYAASTSWRITRPLRKIVGKLKK